MNGLLKNQFYGAIGSFFILLAFFIFTGIILLITGNPTLLTFFAVVATIAFTFNATASLRKEASSNWSKYELTTPVRRKDVTKSRYINHAIWAMFGIILSAFFVGLTVAIHGNLYFYHTVRDPLMLFCIGTGVALLTGSLFYPSIYFFGTDKSEILMIISLLGAAGITAGMIWLLNAAYSFKPMTDFQFYITTAIYMATVIISFVLSYFLTTYIFNRKEY